MEDRNLYEGDMILDPEQREAIERGEFNKAIPLAASKVNLWPRVIPYDIHQFQWHSGRGIIEKSLKDIEKVSCLRFKKRTTQKGGYLKFYKDYTGCSTQVGYKKDEVRRVFLSKGCWETQTTTHELLHALGFYHEQSRPDRDDYVKVHYENILTDAKSQFRKQTYDQVDSLGVPYDYLSIMHYRATAFSKNRGITIETLDKSYQNKIGEQKVMSKLDIEQLNKLYKCNEPITKPPTLSPGKTNAPSSCKDIFHTCASHIAKCSYSKDNVWYKWVAKECRKTCNLCDVAQDEGYEAYAAQDVICEDIYERCEHYKDRCTYPKGDVWYNWASKNCKKTCGLCSGPVTVAPVKTPMTQKPTPAKTKPTYTNPPRTCADKINSCATYKDLCHSSSSWESFGKENCQKTCGYCTGGPTVKPTDNPACKDLADCTSYHGRGYCNPKSPEHFYKYMRTNCIKTCGWCAEIFTPRPTSGVAPPWPKECGISKAQSGRVIAGIESIPGAWPWIARLYRKDTDSSYCGGTLISLTWIVTASHCVEGQKAEKMAIRVGLHDRFWRKEDWEESSPVQEIGVRQIIMHPKYGNPTRMNNDIALIQLEKPVKLTDRVQPACLPAKNNRVKVGTKCYLAGWGKTKHPGVGSQYLQQTSLKIVPNDICHSLNHANYRIAVTKQMVCAGNGHKTLNGACHGDSGGPLVCKENGRWVLHGDVSWGSHNCKNSRAFSVFARITELRDWLDLYIYT